MKIPDIFSINFHWYLPDKIFKNRGGVFRVVVTVIWRTVFVVIFASAAALFFYIEIQQLFGM